MSSIVSQQVVVDEVHRHHAVVGRAGTRRRRWCSTCRIGSRSGSIHRPERRHAAVAAAARCDPQILARHVGQIQAAQIESCSGHGSRCTTFRRRTSRAAARTSSSRSTGPSCRTPSAGRRPTRRRPRRAAARACPRTSNSKAFSRMSGRKVGTFSSSVRRPRFSVSRFPTVHWSWMYSDWMLLPALFVIRRSFTS